MGGGKNIITSLLLSVCTLLKREHWAHITINYHYKGALTKAEKQILKGVNFVHFHTLSAACGYNKLIKRAGINTILTVHSPEPLIDELNGRDKISMSDEQRDRYIRRETQIMDAVDYLMFPVAGALECFTSASDIYKSFIQKKQKQNKIFYVPTALPDSDKPAVENYLSGRKLPEGAKKICYVGRHNQIKGYENLKQIAPKVWEIIPDAYFIIGGNPEGSEPVADSRWIELGWVKTISLLQEIDVFVLPNQQTYFDIIALEILRNGTPFITTLTGGNHYLSEINNGSITFIPLNDAHEAAAAIGGCLERGRNNGTRLLYEEFFTMPKYIKSYKEKIHKLIAP